MIKLTCTHIRSCAHNNNILYYICGLQSIDPGRLYTIHNFIWLNILYKYKHTFNKRVVIIIYFRHPYTTIIVSGRFGTLVGTCIHMHIGIFMYKIYPPIYTYIIVT